MSYIRSQGPKLIDLGYKVCPIAPGEKRPMGRDWGNNPLSVSQCADFEPENAGVGIICGKGESAVYALDFDIEVDESFAEAMLVVLLDAFKDFGFDTTEVLRRVGKAPKFLVPVRMKAGMRKETTPWFTKGDSRARLEVLGEGQQFVAYAMHPETKKPYGWVYASVPGIGRVENPSVMMPSVDTLPFVDRGFIERVKKEFASLALTHGWQEEKSVSPLSVAEADDASLSEALKPKYPMGLTIEDAARYLSELPSDDYDTWLKVGMALHHEFGETRDQIRALNLWNDWSASSPNYKGYDDLRYRWERFGSTNARTVTMRTFVSLYEQKHHDPSADMTEYGIAYRVNNEHRGRMVWSDTLECWFGWNGVHWERLSDTEVTGRVTDVIRDSLWREANALEGEDRVKKMKFYFDSQKARVTNAVKSLLPTCGAERDEMINPDLPRGFLGVANGDIEIATGRFLPPSKERRTFLDTDIVYDPDATCPLWEQTVADAFFGETELVDYIQRIFGYALMGNPSEEMMFIFYGNGCNGKSTILNTVRAVFGNAGCSMDPDVVTSVGASGTASGGAPRADVVALAGKRLVLIPETDQRARLKESFVKRLVSTDEITARGMYERRMRSFKPTWVPIMATNYLPRIDGDDEGIWRRVHTVGFNRNFDNDEKAKRDSHRSEKLKAEYPGILNWLLEGYQKYLEVGLRKPKSVTAESNEYRSSMDSLQEWLEDRCILGRDQWVSTTDAWNSWKSFSQLNGVEHAITTKTALTQRLVKKGISARVMKVSGKALRCYLGIALDDGSVLPADDSDDDWL